MKKIILLILSILMLTCLCSCAKKQETKENLNTFETLDDFNGVRFATLVGSIYSDIIEEKFPNSVISYFSTYGDCVSALVEGKVDAFLGDTVKAKEVCKNNKEVTYFSKTIESLDYAYACSKNDKGKKLADEISAYINKLKTNGELTKLVSKWMVNDDVSKADYNSLENINGELVVAADLTCYPFTFSYEGDVVGFDVDFLTGFCKENGYSLRFDVYDFAGMISAVSAGKADVIGSSLMVTEERAEKMNFSIPFLAGTGSVIFRKENSSSEFNNFYELSGKTIGILDGSVSDLYVEENVRNASYEFYSSIPDMILALEQGRIAGFTISSTSLDCLIATGVNIKSAGSIYEEQYAYMFNKDNRNISLENKINEFIDNKIVDGTIDELYEKWCDPNKYETLDLSLLTDTNGTIEMGVCSVIGEPHCFYHNNELVGFDIAIMYEFCKENGYALHLTDYSFGGMLSAITTGKADLVGSSITVTEERKKAVNFSNTYKTGSIDIAVAKYNKVATEVNLIDSIKDSFERTFIREDRYKLFISGIISTINITVFSVIFGSLLGFMLFILFRLNNKIIDALLRVYTWLINGMPTVVVLMVFFYIIFASSSIEGRSIAIIAFSVIFSVTVFGLLRLCFAGISKGQYEAAYALGYSKAKTLFKIIIPQIATTFLPSYRSEIITLMKATSIVGYIAVQDLTKMSDIVRSRTYEAFFPLIASTVFYFVIAGFFIVVINLINKKFDTKARKNSDILKGVTVHD